MSTFGCKRTWVGAVQMSASGPKQTLPAALQMSAFGGKADIAEFGRESPAATRSNALNTSASVSAKLSVIGNDGVAGTLSIAEALT